MVMEKVVKETMIMEKNGNWNDGNGKDDSWKDGNGKYDTRQPRRQIILMAVQNLPTLMDTTRNSRPSMSDHHLPTSG